MTLDEAMAKTEAKLDKFIQDQIERDEVAIADMGATADELAEFIATQKAEYAKCKAETLAEIRRGLAHWNAPTGKLQ